MPKTLMQWPIRVKHFNPWTFCGNKNKCSQQNSQKKTKQNNCGQQKWTFLKFWKVLRARINHNVHCSLPDQLMKKRHFIYYDSKIQILKSQMHKIVLGYDNSTYWSGVASLLFSRAKFQQKILLQAAKFFFTHFSLSVTKLM